MRDLLDECNLSKFKLCEHCIFGKHKRVKFNASIYTTKGILDYVHVDVRGTYHKTSLSGANYMLTVIDDYSRKVWPFFLKNDSNVFDVFRKWKIRVEKKTENKLNCFVLKMSWSFILLFLIITTATKALSGTTQSYTLLNRMVWLRG
jgi:hypothetical protein